MGINLMSTNLLKTTCNKPRNIASVVSVISPNSSYDPSEYQVIVRAPIDIGVNIDGGVWQEYLVEKIILEHGYKRVVFVADNSKED